MPRIRTFFTFSGGFMTISNRLSFFLFLFFACVSIPQLNANTKTTQDDEILNILIQTSINQLNRLDQIIEHVARLISDHQIKSLQNQEQALQASTAIRAFIKEISSAKQNFYLESDTNKISILMELSLIAEALAIHIQQALNTGLKELKSFGLKEYTAIRAQRIAQNKDENLNTLILKVDSRITKLEKTVRTIGLTWYNKLARKIDNSIITPMQRNNLGLALAIGTLSGIGAWFLIGEYGETFTHDMPDGSYAKTILNKLHTSWGKPIYRDERNRPVDSFGNEIPNIYGEGYTWRSRMADSAKGVMKNPFSYLVFTSLAGTLYKAWDDIKGSVSEKVSNIWNRLRGGAYLKAKSNGIWNFQPTHRFDKIIGLETVKAEFSVLLQFLKDPEGSIQRGLIPSKAYLLTGEPGVGKTFAVEGLCGEIEAITQGSAHQFRFLRVDAPMIHSPYSGGITGILEFASRNAPCIIFIDEIDLLGLQRTGDNKMLSEFLTSMGNSIDNDPMKMVVLIAATNKSHMLDKALLRTGRFKEIRIDHPTFEARKQFLYKELKSYGLDTERFDLDALARETNQHTIEDLRSLIRRGILTSWMIQTPLNQTLLDYGLNKEIHHILLEDNRSVPENEQKLLAAYFAGRAFALNLFNTNEELAKVTIKPVMTKLQERAAWQELVDEKEQAKIAYGSIFTMPKHTDSINLLTKKELLDTCKSYLAGTVAQELLLKNAQVNKENSDYERAFLCAQRYVLNGLDFEKLSTDLKKQYQEKAHALLIKCKRDVKHALKPHIKTIQALANELEESAILSGKEVKEIIEKHTADKTAPIQS